MPRAGPELHITLNYGRKKIHVYEPVDICLLTIMLMCNFCCSWSHQPSAATISECLEQTSNLIYYWSFSWGNLTTSFLTLHTYVGSPFRLMGHTIRIFVQLGYKAWSWRQSRFGNRHHSVWSTIICRQHWQRWRSSIVRKWYWKQTACSQRTKTETNSSRSDQNTEGSNGQFFWCWTPLVSCA